MIFNIFSHKTLRQKLRNEVTVVEQLLWERLRRKRLEGYKFRRQHGIGRYIVDFYCPTQKLVIELDGAQHAEVEALEYDAIRSAYIEGLGLKVIRFWNSDVMNDLDVVCDEILLELE
jgi:very-short-patch-repair endonuclease